MDNALDWDAELAQTTVHLIAGSVFGPVEASRDGYTSDDVIRAVRKLVAERS